MGRDDREYGSKRRNFGRIDPFCLFAAVPLAVVGVSLVFSDVPWLAPILLLFAALVVLLDSWLHRPGRLIDPRAAKAALRRAKEAEGDRSDVRRGSRSYDTGAQSQVRSRTRSTTNGARQPNRQQQPRQRQATPYREPQRGRSRY
jgi:hypothetical protein